MQMSPGFIMQILEVSDGADAEIPFRIGHRKGRERPATQQPGFCGPSGPYALDTQRARRALYLEPSNATK